MNFSSLVTHFLRFCYTPITISWLQRAIVILVFLHLSLVSTFQMVYIYILEAKHDKPSPRTRTPVTGVFAGSGRRNTIIFFPLDPPPYALRLRNKYKRDIFIFPPSLTYINPDSSFPWPTLTCPPSQTFPNVTYPGILSLQVGERKKQLDLLLYQFPRPNHIPVHF